jgi:hypothetical protein
VVRFALKGILGRKLRTALTAIAIVLGVAISRTAFATAAAPMARYELLLLGQGRPELRLADCDLALGDLVEVADRLWRVQRISPPSGENVELRYVLMCDGEAPRGEARQAWRRARVIKADLADARDKSGVLRDAASRVRAQARRVGYDADRSPHPRTG